VLIDLRTAMKSGHPLRSKINKVLKVCGFSPVVACGFSGSFEVGQVIMHPVLAGETTRAPALR
jgi:hypothetical protein